jgi:hypothetical protein
MERQKQFIFRFKHPILAEEEARGEKKEMDQKRRPRALKS